MPTRNRVSGPCRREVDRLVAATGAEPDDQAEVAQEHDGREDDDFCERSLAGRLGDRLNFPGLVLGKGLNFDASSAW